MIRSGLIITSFSCSPGVLSHMGAIAGMMHLHHFSSALLFLGCQIRFTPLLVDLNSDDDTTISGFGFGLCSGTFLASHTERLDG